MEKLYNYLRNYKYLGIFVNQLIKISGKYIKMALFKIRRNGRFFKILHFRCVNLFIIGIIILSIFFVKNIDIDIASLLMITSRKKFRNHLKYNKVIKREMRTMALNILKPVKLSHGVFGKTPCSSMSFTRNCRFKPGTPAAKDLAADDSGKHVHRIKEVCEKQDCETNICQSLCSQLQEIKTDGHYTHEPIAGKYSRFLSDHDGNGADKSQYYTKNLDKKKQTSAAKAQQYYKNKEIKNANKIDNYTKDPKISKKLDE